MPDPTVGQNAMSAEHTDSWPPHPELTNACPVCSAPPGFACVRKGTRWFTAPALAQPHPGREVQSLRAVRIEAAARRVMDQFLDYEYEDENESGRATIDELRQALDA